MIGHFIGGPLDGQTKNLENEHNIYVHLLPYRRHFKLRTKKIIYNKTRLLIGLATIYILANLDITGTQVNVSKIKRDALTLKGIGAAYDNQVLRRAAGQTNATSRR